MKKDEKYKKRLAELKPLIFSLQSAIELFGRDQAKKLARFAFEKYAHDRFVKPYLDIPADRRWAAFRGNLLHNADDIEYSIEKSDDNMVKVKYRRCLFYEIFRDFGLEDFVPIYCQTDYTTASGISPDIEFSRTRSIAGGAAYCDHCWTYRRR